MWKRVASNYIDAEPEFDASSASTDLVDYSNYDDTGRFTKGALNLVHRGGRNISRQPRGS